MLTQLLAGTATIIGLLSTWLLGRRYRCGWIAGITCSLLWIAVNIQVAVWAGIAQATINTALSARAWHAWRHATADAD